MDMQCNADHGDEHAAPRPFKVRVVEGARPVGTYYLLTGPGIHPCRYSGNGAHDAAIRDAGRLNRVFAAGAASVRGGR